MIPPLIKPCAWVLSIASRFARSGADRIRAGMVILDTDHLSLLERAESAEGKRLRDKLARVPPTEIASTIVTYEEQTRGWLAYVARARTVAQQVEAYRRLER